MDNKMIKHYAAARRVGTPIIGISTFDPEATMRLIQRECTKTGHIPNDVKTALIQWDIIRGWTPRNQEAESTIQRAIQKTEDKDHGVTLSPVGSLETAIFCPEDSVIFMLNTHHHFKDVQFIQALWNLRDHYKCRFSTIVMLSPGFDLPSELQQDVLLIEEELPKDEDIRDIVKTTLSDAELIDKVTPETIELAVDALRGLAAFPAEQATAMCLSADGLHIDDLWDRKRSLIGQSPGLSVYKDDFNFSKIGGLDAAKAKFTRIINGKRAPKVIVFIDEIEKAMAGTLGDSSGTSQDQLGVLLSEMQDKGYTGSIFIGPPGAAKSAFAKSIANEAGILTIRMDLGEMKGSLVGESEQRIRQAMRVVEAVAGEQGALFIATSNDIRAIKPELKRRFKKGILFFDLPTAEERAKIWEVHCKNFGYTYKPGHITFDEGWTGAEIENCVTAAWEEDITFEEAAKGIVPVSVSGKEDIERLRKEAHDKYLSASYVGVYQMPGGLQTTTAVSKSVNRKMSFEK